MQISASLLLVEMMWAGKRSLASKRLNRPSHPTDAAYPDIRGDTCGITKQQQQQQQQQQQEQEEPEEPEEQEEQEEQKEQEEDGQGKTLTGL